MKYYYDHYFLSYDSCIRFEQLATSIYRVYIRRRYRSVGITVNGNEDGMDFVVNGGI